mmetsp:Transcript_19560/g.29504  ORF Transcript_19560/g.29504 Transcript_19560/m.29504 type:complete len:353 (+) Transcript_19560:132-1190(+)|eukprot:scaffold7119_cov112-Skeletonema_dohrnii-CCMP3373.AAC.10
MSCNCNECYADEFDGEGYEDEGYYDNCDDDYESFEAWTSKYVRKGLNKWGKGVCWDWCEHGYCYDDFNCGMAHPTLAIETTQGKGCSIEIKSSGATIGLPLKGKSEGARLPNIECIIKGLGFVEKDKDTPQQDQEPLVFESEAELNVRYVEKEDAKSLGALWNPGETIWYVPAGIDVRPFERWSPKVDGKYVLGMVYDSKAYLSTTYQEKNEVKALGAWWDPKKNKWYVPPGKTLRPFLKWNPEVNDRPVVGPRMSNPLFVNDKLDKASAVAQLQDRGFDFSVFEFPVLKRMREQTLREEMKAAGYSEGIESPAGVKRTRCSSPGRDTDDRKLPAAVTPEKYSNPKRGSREV